MLQPIILETTLNFIFGLQLSSKWSPNGLLFTSKVVSIWSPMETFSSLPISSQPCMRMTLIVAGSKCEVGGSKGCVISPIKISGQQRGPGGHGHGSAQGGQGR